MSGRETSLADADSLLAARPVLGMGPAESLALDASASATTRRSADAGKLRGAAVRSRRTAGCAHAAGRRRARGAAVVRSRRVGLLLRGTVFTDQMGDRGAAGACIASRTCPHVHDLCTLSATACPCACRQCREQATTTKRDLNITSNPPGARMHIVLPACRAAQRLCCALCATAICGRGWVPVVVP